MPPTRSRRARGIIPIGDSVPSGVITVTESPTARPRSLARSTPTRMPGTSSAERASKSSTRPAVIERPRSVTSGSSAGSMPLSVTNASPRSVRSNALPRTAGAAPTTPSMARNLATSLR